MAAKIYLWIAICCFVLLIDLKSVVASDELPGSWICNGTDANNRCALNCLLYPVYFSGYCNEANRCICVRRPTNEPSTKPIVYGPCVATDSDNKCFLTCLFFNRFKSGFCQNGLCLCVPK